ncbi:hypothetical protein [Bacillus marinisedimentorum]|nr:hypothetical protein [Bacillus marinisedimentorum]
MGRGKSFNQKKQNHEHRQPKQEEPLMIEPVASEGDRPKYVQKTEE